MTLIQKLDNLLKLFKVKKMSSFQDFSRNSKFIFYLLLFVALLIIFIFVNNQITKKQRIESNNLDKIVKSGEFKGLGEYLISKINSPYEEVEYLIQNNDSIEKILKKLNVNANDLKKISNSLKEKKLTNISKNRKWRRYIPISKIAK